eukprot:52657-Hanusia_phi.AAC.11
MKLRLLALVALCACPCGAVPQGFDGAMAPLVVAEMQRVFVLLDGSVIQNPTDGVVLQAVYDELLAMSPAFASIPTLEGIRNVTLFPDQELVKVLLLAVMGNFHSQTLSDADIYNDVQVVYDPVKQRFVTRQNMRDTEILVFQVLLIVCVLGLFLVFLVGRKEPHAEHQSEAAKPEKATAGRMSERIGERLALPSWAQGARLAYRG